MLSPLQTPQRAVARGAAGEVEVAEEELRRHGQTVGVPRNHVLVGRAPPRPPHVPAQRVTELPVRKGRSAATAGRNGHGGGERPEDTVRVGQRTVPALTA
ncbi:hypothetical protein GCM10023238_39400 [Streptomyces heliomycini]